MGTKDKRVDAYIEKSAEFAKPILAYIRTIVHKACPEVSETIRWGFPHFDYKGIFCSMAAFKEHCAFGFWKASLMLQADVLKAKNIEAMGNLGQIRKFSDLPKEMQFLAMIQQARQLNDDGIKLPPRKKIVDLAPIQVPEDILIALKKNKEAFESFDGFSPSHKHEYLEWITEAKTTETRNKRVTKMLGLLEQGKSRNWKYEKPRT